VSIVSPVVVSTLLIIGAVLLGRHLLFSEFDKGSRPELLSRVLLPLGLMLSGSFVGGDQPAWQKVAAIACLAGAAICAVVARSNRSSSAKQSPEH
jgi:hypothetical protein